MQSDARRPRDGGLIAEVDERLLLKEF